MNWQKIVKRAGWYVLLFAAATLAYGSLFSLFLGEVGGKAGLGAFLEFWKALFRPGIFNYWFDFSVLAFFAGIPSVLIAWLSGKLSNKLNFTLLPAIALAIPLFIMPLTHISVFGYPVNSSIEEWMNVNAFAAAVFDLAFAFLAAGWTTRRRRIARSAEAVLTGEEYSSPDFVGGGNTYSKFVVGFLALVILGGAAFFGWASYETNAKRRAVDDLAARLEAAKKESYDRALADTYGGKTPQETLRMYIEAVEKGDYELASRYFVEGGRNAELKSFENATTGTVTSYLKPLKEALNKDGKYTADGKYFSFSGKVLIGTVLYPNGIWKITEI